TDQQRVTIVGAVQMARVEEIAGDAPVDVRGCEIERGVLHPAHAGILDGDGRFTRKVGERPAQLLDVHRSPTYDQVAEKPLRSPASCGVPDPSAALQNRRRAGV